MKQSLLLWAREWVDVLLPVLEVVLIVLVAWVLRRLAQRLVNRLVARYQLPPEVAVGGRRTLGFIIQVAALLLILNRLGVSGTVLWTAFTGFAAVGAVAFFAAWSVLSNIFCTLLILTTRPFRLYDHIEILEGGDKPGLRGQVVDINLVYTTLEEPANGGASLLRVPNNLFFQRTVRRWRDPPAAAAPPVRTPGDEGSTTG